MEEMFIQCSLFEDLEEVDDKYTKKVSIPQYLPNVECPRIYSLIDSTKYRQLLRNIENSHVSEEQKEFLRLAAARHLVFDYSNIADYYAHQDKEMQELMEESALVLIDFNDAIANGYVKLSENIKKIMRETGKQAGSDYHTQNSKNEE